jgi:hypothetical protein
MHAKRVLTYQDSVLTSLLFLRQPPIYWAAGVLLDVIEIINSHAKVPCDTIHPHNYISFLRGYFILVPPPAQKGLYGVYAFSVNLVRGVDDPQIVMGDVFTVRHHE